MRPKTRIWILLSVLLGVAVGLYWRGTLARRAGSGAGEMAAVGPQAISLQFTNLTAAASVAPGAVLVSTQFEVGAMQSLLAPGTNRLGERVSNVGQPFPEFLRSGRAVLLRNALIDTGLEAPKIPEHLRAKGDPGAYIVQARGVVSEEFRAALGAAGAEIVSYVPNNAFLVRANAGVAGVLRASPLTQAVLPFEPYYKLDAGLLRLAVRQELSPYGLLNVVSFPGQSGRMLAALRALGAEPVGEAQPTVFGDIWAVKVPADGTAAAAQIPEVQMLGVRFEKRLANDLTRVMTRISTNIPFSTNVPIVRPPESHYRTASNTFLTGEGVIVAVADTGVDDAHPDLAGRILPGSYTVPDYDGHGTHVVGTFIGDGKASPLTNNGAALGSHTNAVFSGMAPRARALVQDYGLPDGVLQRNTVVAGALISNNSWGFGGDNDYDIFAASYDAAVRDSTPGITGEQEVAYVFAAGNEGGGGDNGLSGIPGSVISPATGKNVLTVGGSDLPRHITNEVFRCVTITNFTSTNVVCETNLPWAGMTDTNNQVAPFSSRGNVGIGIEGLFGRFKPDVVAPGAMLVSTRSKDYLEPDGVTNTFPFQFNNVSIAVNRTNVFTLIIPANTIRFEILAVTNLLSPTNLTLGLGAGYTPAAAAVTITTNNYLRLDATTTPALVPGRLYYSIANTNHAPNANFDLILLLTITNNVGNYFTVLRQLNAPLQPHYRYEAGTSMAAPAVSGFLALLQEYLATNFNARPSPALLKALAINGARSLSPNYNLQINAPINHQGWGLVNMSNSIPFGLTLGASNGPMRFYDQKLTNSLATGGTETYEITVPDEAKSFPLRVTLVWTDPPGNPVTGIKLVNDMNLSVLGDRTNTVVISTNSSLTNSTSLLYLGNNFPPGSDFTDPIVLSSTDTNILTPTNVHAVVEATRDFVNNVENVYIQPPLSSRYTVLVKGHRVNVNAVNSHTNGVVQDYALVISSGNVTTSNRVHLLVNGPLFTNDPTARISALIAAPIDTNDPNATASAFLLNQRVGANSALLTSTNGATNQWAFFTYTNVPTAQFTNVIILTFLPPNLSLARYREADIDLYVSRGTGSNLFTLDQNTISAAAKSTRRGGTELLVFEDAQPNEVFYIGVKSEDQQAANFSLFAASSKRPPSTTDSSNNIIVRGLALPAIIPDGSPEQPGGTNVMLVVMPRDADKIVARAYVTNAIYHEEAGDLVGILNRVGGTNAVTLNNHRTWTEWENPVPPYGVIYDDSGEGDLGGLTTTPPVFLPDGPGRLLDFLGEPAGQFWSFTISDNALFHTGYVNDITLVLAPASTNTTDPNVLIDRRFCVPPGQWRYAAANIPNDAFNMETCVLDFGTPLPIQVFIREGDFPDLGTFDYHFQGDPPGECFNIGLGDNPPLFPGRWYFGLYNSNAADVCVNLKVTISRKSVASPALSYYSLDTPKNLMDDATTNSLLFVPDRGRISDLRVGLRVNHERASDLVFHLRSPTGTRLLLAENRGGPFGTNYGASAQQSNVFAVSYQGGPDPVTNVYTGTATEGTVQIDYEFFPIADRMTIYYESNLIYDTGLIAGPGRFFVNYGPGASSDITIIMNENGNTNRSTQWQYTATLFSQYIYTTFTENTNLTDTPIKFGTAPFTNGGAFLRQGRRTVLYSNDFESVVGSEWSPATTNTTPGPPLHTGFLGNHVNDTLSFTFVSNQPPHSLIEVSFDLFLMNSWDGDPPVGVGNPGPDIWEWNFAGTNVLRTSFSNFEPPRFPYGHHQSYPGQFPTNNVPRTGAFLNDVFGSILPLGSTEFNGVDSVYRITRVFAHSGGPIQMSFNGLNLQPGIDEPWGIDNVVITALDPLDLKGSFYLPEEPITPFFGEQARGFWNLEVWDSRLGGALASTPQLVSWKLEIAFPQTNPPVYRLTNGSIFTTNIVGDQVYYFAVDVPCTSGYATNTLSCLTPSLAGLNLVFNQYVLPTNGPFDVLLLTNVTLSGTNVLTNGFPPLVSATRYYLAVSNADPSEVNDFQLEINFSKCGPLPLMNHEIRCTSIPVGEFQLYDYYVAPNAIGFIIETFSADGNVDLYVQHLIDPVPVPTTTNSTLGGTNNEYISFGANIGVFADGLWRIGVTNVDAQAVNYCVRVTEFYDTDVTTLPLDSTVFGQSVTNTSYYRVSLNPGCSSVEFKTESHSPAGVLSIYVARERVPSPLDYDLFGTSDGFTPPLGPTLGAGYTPGVWYIAIINTNPVPIGFDVTITPTGACFAGGPVIKASSASYSAAGFKLEWNASASEQYRVEFTDTLAPAQWQTITNVISSDNGHFEYLDTSAQTNAAAGQRFYRLLRVQ